MSEKLLEELKVLRLQPGETLVLQSDRMLCDDEMLRLRDAADQAGIKAVILGGGITVAAVQSA